MSYIETAHVDGACDQNNTKAGGWAVVYNNGERKISGNAQATTNNEMELLAIKVAVTNANPEFTLDIRSDSEWAVKSITGEYKAKTNLRLLDEVKEALAGREKPVRFTNIPRNSEPSHREADRMARIQKEAAIRDLKSAQEGNTPVGSLDGQE